MFSFVFEYAQEKQHTDCIALCEALAQMSSSQRMRLYRNYRAYAQ